MALIREKVVDVPIDFELQNLSRWFEATAPQLGEIKSARRLAGGQSNPTYRVQTSRADLVLRRKPFGPILASAHSVDREFRLLEAVHPSGFPVPKPIALCTNDGVIGSMFYVMEMVEGRSFWDGDLPDVDHASRRPIYHAMIDALAKLHAIDPASVGLEGFGRPGNYFARQVERWRRQYRASQTEESTEVDRLIEFLGATVPAQSRTTIIHGDYRIDNLIYRADRPEVAAVLDWELSTLGDPMADLAYLALNWVTPHSATRASIGGLDHYALGIPTLAEIIERYCAAAGLDGIPALEWYFAFNLFRIIGIVQGIKKRMLDGNASSPDAPSVVGSLPALIESALQYAEQVRAVGR